MSLDTIAVFLAVIGWGGGISMSMYASRLERIIKELKQERDTWKINYDFMVFANQKLRQQYEAENG